MFDKIIKISLNLLVFLLPSFWLPFSFEAFEFNKQYLLFFLVSLSLFAWLAKMIFAEGELKFKRTPLDIFVAGFLFTAVLSAVFSVDKSVSIFGFYGRFSDGLVGLLSLGALYFLITNNADVQRAAGFLKTFLWSIFFVILSGYLAVSGIFNKISFLPSLVKSRIFSPAAGSLESLAVFLSVVIVLLTGLILFAGLKSKISKIGPISYWVILLAALGLLVIVDYKSAWLILLASLVLFMLLALWKRIFRENVNRLLLPIFLITVGFFGYLVDSPQLGIAGISSLPKEQVLDKGISWQVALGAATQNVKSIFLGSGPGTFSYDFAKEKPVEFNQNAFWQIRFDRPGSYLAEILGTAGFLGLLSYLVLIGAFLLLSYFLLEAKTNFRQTPLLMAFLAALMAQFFHYQNAVLAFSFWLFLALAAVNWEKPVSEKKLSLKNFPELNLVFNVFLMLLGLGILTMFYFGARFYLADIIFAKGGQTERLERAVKLNPYQPQYWTILARSYWQQVQNEIAKPEERQDQAFVQNRIALAIEAGKTAVLKGPSQVAGFETMAIIYRDIGQAVGGASDWSIKYFEEAIALEPTNPVLRTELAKLLSESDMEGAQAQIAKAKELKPDFVDAVLLEAVLYEREGNLDEAAKVMEKLALSYPFNIDVLFQLGRLYFNSNRVDEAIVQFSNVLILFPSHSNSLYSLGLAYQKKGNAEKARSYFEKVLELNPDNQDVKEKLGEMKGKKP